VFHVNGVKKIWNHTQSRKPEEMLAEVAVGFVVVAVPKEQRDLRWEEIHHKSEVDEDKRK
jgi:hypothetical protein